jgi:DNA-binding XRE family transcriptional regulator
MKTAKNRGQTKADETMELAIAVLVERIQRLPPEDREDLFQVSKAFYTSQNREEVESAHRAFSEILEQSKGKVQSFLVDDEPIGLDQWLTFVSGRIRRAREEASMTQEQLEAATGLPQSHISRLENAVHSPSSLTLEKIAKATGKPASYFDPCHGDGDDQE